MILICDYALFYVHGNGIFGFFRVNEQK